MTGIIRCVLLQPPPRCCCLCACVSLWFMASTRSDGADVPQFPFGLDRARRYQQEYAKRRGMPVEFVNSIKIRFVARLSNRPVSTCHRETAWSPWAESEHVTKIRRSKLKPTIRPAPGSLTHIGRAGHNQTAPPTSRPKNAARMQVRLDIGHLSTFDNRNRYGPTCSSSTRS
ncbi:MAG: hypothetical protein L0Y71_04940, partial [Gemmataceae bacterium]|nr:hypothetical protein [Gemmataceae bacterium]